MPAEVRGRDVCADQRLASYFLQKLFSLVCAITISFSLATIFAWETAYTKHV